MIVSSSWACTLLGDDIKTKSGYDLKLIKELLNHSYWRLMKGVRSNIIFILLLLSAISYYIFTAAYGINIFYQSFGLSNYDVVIYLIERAIRDFLLLFAHLEFYPFMWWTSFFFGRPLDSKHNREFGPYY